MNKIERVARVLEGREVDYPPISLWYHFGIQHGNGEQFARITLEYFRYYDFDYLKVMNDYYYPAPEGLDAVRSAADLERFGPVDPERCEWREQLKALRIIASELKGRAWFIETLFDPWQSIRRSVAGEGMAALVENHPAALHAALDRVADNLIAYARKAIEIGAAGIFMSVPAAAEIVSREVFRAFVKPYALKVFEAVSRLAPMNTAHIHGESLFMEECLDFPVAVFSWWDRGPSGPPLDAVRRRIPGCVMGGIDQTLLTRRSPAFLKAHVAEGVALGRGGRFLLANGCSIDTWVSPRIVKAVVAAAREGSGA